MFVLCISVCVREYVCLLVLCMSVCVRVYVGLLKKLPEKSSSISLKVNLTISMENLASTYQFVAFLKVCTITCSN